MNYYIYVNNTSVGPMTESQMLAYNVTPDTPVSTDGMNWQPLYTYPHLMQLISNGSQTTNKKIIAGILAILLGTIGVQYFYLGKTSGGFITILLSIITCGAWGVITLIQGILMLTMSDSEFERKYVDTTKTFPLF